MQSSIARRPAALALLAAAAVLLAALLIAPRAEAASIYACQKKKGGTLRLVTSKTKCKKTEKKIKWNTTGTAGKNGTNGTNGTGANGNNGANGTNGTNGAPGEPRKAITFNVTRDTGATKTDLFTAGGVTVKLQCFFFLANFVSIQATGASGTMSSGAIYTDSANDPPSIPQTTVYSDIVDGSDNTLSLLSSNTAAPTTNKGHVNATIINATSAILLDYFVQAAASPTACTVRGVALVVPLT